MLDDKTLIQHSWLHVQVLYQPWAMNSLTHVFGGNTFAVATPAAYSIGMFDAFENSVPAVHARAAPCNHGHHCRGPDVLSCGEGSELRQDGAATALPAGDGHFASSLSRH